MQYRNLFVEFEKDTGMVGNQIALCLGWSRPLYSFNRKNGTRKLHLHDIVTLSRLYMQKTGKEFLPFLTRVCGMDER